jgi:hypothetical protein
MCFLLNTLQIPQHFSNPSPLLFLGAGVLVGVAVDTYRDSSKADRYQGRILGAGMLFGVEVASWADNFWMGLKSYVAVLLMLALVLSSIFHRLLGMWSHPREICQEKLDTGAKLEDHGVERGDLGARCVSEIAGPESSYLSRHIGIQVSPSSGVPMSRTSDIAVTRGLRRQI